MTSGSRSFTLGALLCSAGASLVPTAAHARRGVTTRTTPPRALLDSALAHNAGAAFFASVLSTVLLHPIDTLKTRLQSESGAAAAEASTVMSDGIIAAGPSAGAAPLFQSNLYAGLPANVLKEAPDAAVFLALSEELSRSLTSSPWFASHLTITLLLSGAVGDACGSILRLPAEVLCKRLQAAPAGHTSAGWHTALVDTSTESWMASWSAILVRDVPSAPPAPPSPLCAHGSSHSRCPSAHPPSHSPAHVANPAAYAVPRAAL
jgi:hypothetical protein